MDIPATVDRDNHIVNTALRLTREQRLARFRMSHSISSVEQHSNVIQPYHGGKPISMAQHRRNLMNAKKGLRSFR